MSSPPAFPLGPTVEDAAKGDGAAWDRLFDRFHPVVYRYALARTGNQSVAEEIAQDVFVAAVKGVRGLRERSQPGVEGWFIRIARFKVADWARRKAREAQTVAPQETFFDPSETAITNLAAAEVRRAMESLTDEQQDVVVRRFVLDQSLEEVARSTGRRVGAVKALQHRALATLARHLDAESTAG
jgi:RNA polymerase sigma-70 factor, ECF subfamily